MKIAFVVLSHEVETITLAVKSVTKKTGMLIEVFPRTAEDLADPQRLEEFIKFAQTSHVVLMHLMGGKKGFTGFDRVASALRETDVPLFASDVQSDHEIVSCSTVNQDDYQKIHQYINYGGLENYENLLIFLANRFAGSHFEAKPPKKMPLQAIYHPNFGHILTLTEYLEKAYIHGRPTVGIFFHNDPLKTGDINLANSLIRSVEQ
ncbi:MAG: cobaltochelatase subunit CobN, partial [Candidatus Bathyarchaeia archaeon]